MPLLNVLLGFYSELALLLVLSCRANLLDKRGALEGVQALH